MIIFSKIKNILKSFVPIRKRDKVSVDISKVKKHLKKEDYKKALKLLNTLIGNDKLNPEAYYLRHFCHLNLNNHDEYIKDLQQACKLYQYENDAYMYSQCLKELEVWVSNDT